VGGEQARGLAPVGHAQPAQDLADAMVDGVGGDGELAGDFLGAQAAKHEMQDFTIPFRQRGDGVFPGRRVPHGRINDEGMGLVQRFEGPA
jgi:hypothetical protein